MTREVLGERRRDVSILLRHWDRRWTKMLFVNIILLAGWVVSVESFIVPFVTVPYSLRSANEAASSRTSLASNDSKNKDEMGEEGGLFEGIQNVASRTASKVKQGGSKVAGATTARLAGLAEKGGSTVESALAVTSARLSDIADKSGEVANVATSNIVGFVEKGSSGVVSMADATASSIVGFVVQGSANAASVASVASSGIAGLVEKGSADVVSVANATSNTAGEIVRWIDGQAKEGTNAANTQSKALVLSFTGKKDYKFGDISKELLRRVASTEIDLNDILLLLKLLLTIGVSFGPLAKALPLSVLLQMLNVSLEKQVGGKVVEVLAGSIDERFSLAFNNDDKFQLGDAVKRSAMAGILKFTGKDSYEDGDIERAVTGNETKTNQTNGSNDVLKSLPTATKPKKTLEIRVGPEFEEWDEKFRESSPDLDELRGVDARVLDMELANELVEEGAFTAASFDSKFCIYCGTKLPGVANYCSSCGERQP